MIRMNSEEESPIGYNLTQKEILEIVGDWFTSKRIHYTDEMFSEYFSHIKTNCLEKDKLTEYLSQKASEIIFKWLSAYHSENKKKFKEAAEEEEELVPEWLLKQRYAELETMFASKIFTYVFTRYEIEYDSAIRTFTVTLHTEKQMDDLALGILTNDVDSYLKNRPTLLNFKEGKIIELKSAELDFEIIW